jgi:hypothetical protein
MKMAKQLTGAEPIAKERRRQIEKEGWTAEHDNEHTEDELALVAALYATPILLVSQRHLHDGSITFIDPWPWYDQAEITRYADAGFTKVKAWDKRKKHNKFRRLVIAGALIAAEIDRLQRIDRSKA